MQVKFPFEDGGVYYKTLFIRVILFSRGNQPRYIHEILFSRFFIYSSIIRSLEIIGEDFIFASLCSRIKSVLQYFFENVGRWVGRSARWSECR